ncbi:ATP-binding cassette domain-containing protein [Nonomuraea sp. NPDC048826]|uniref:ATP-binding cassette domain-containing protein n=1 Tax=Nonomuraea sp. NPDC048826 TaxID=3364347 RepID=UPI00370F988D
MCRNGGMAIRAHGVRRTYGSTAAVTGVDLHLAEGTLLSLLGPNGAGKTTLVRILATLLRMDAGRALVAGFDVERRPREVRRRIAVSGQYTAIDGLLTGRENVELFGRLLGLSRRDATARAAELLDLFELAAAEGRPARTYSGGMRRRLDLAMCLVARPAVLFLDEPTTGLDPIGRGLLWSIVRDAVAEGTAVLLTTQYLEEADRLADRLMLLESGAVVADGTPDELKREIGQERLEVAVTHPRDLPATRRVLELHVGEPPTIDVGRLRATVRIDGRLTAVAGIAAALAAERINLAEFALRRPSLDEVFATLLGQEGGDAGHGEPGA